MEQDSLFAHSDITFDETDGTAHSATLHVEVSITNDGSNVNDICVIFLIMDPDGIEVLSSAEPTQEILAPGHTATISEDIRLLYPRLWTSSKPNLYQVTAILEDCGNGDRLDIVSTNHGFRSLHYDANQGFFLNQEHFKVRGFCDHDTFGVVGMAVPDRINLFRVSIEECFYIGFKNDNIY
jgi:beta-galactosidase